MNALSNSLLKQALAPGVHFEATVPKRKIPFQTGVPLFIGFGQITGRAESVKNIADNTMVLNLTSQEQFEQSVRIDIPGGFLDYAVRGFFENGGRTCEVVTLPEVSGMPRLLEKLFEDKGALEEIENIDLVCLPDLMAQEADVYCDKVSHIQQQVLEYCRRMGDRFAILDTPSFYKVCKSDQLSGTAVKNNPWGQEILKYQFNFSNKGLPVEGAIYFPWIYVKPLPRHRNAFRIRVPPSGHIAGIYARSDAAFGVHKAPANEIVDGALDLEINMSDKSQVKLNNYGINCLRVFPGRGILVWGTRTLSGRADWKYVNVRRLFLTLVRWSSHHLDDLVFEPHNEPLWHRVRDRVGDYCYDLYRRGALKGLTPSEAYFVKCDAETNPPEVRNKGQLICEVGLAPVVPAEFIVVRIIQSPAGATATIPNII